MFWDVGERKEHVCYKIQVDRTINNIFKNYFNELILHILKKI